MEFKVGDVVELREKYGGYRPKNRFVVEKLITCTVDGSYLVYIKPLAEEHRIGVYPFRLKLVERESI